MCQVYRAYYWDTENSYLCSLKLVPTTPVSKGKRGNILLLLIITRKYPCSHQLAKIRRDRCPWVEGLHLDWADWGCGLGWSLWYHATSLSELVVWKIVAQVPLEQAYCTFSFFCSCRWSRTYAGGWCKNSRSRSRERDYLTQVEWT